MSTNFFRNQMREAIRKSLTSQLEPPQDTIKNKSILMEAESIVNGERRSDYGPSESFGKMARVHNELWGSKLEAKDFVKMLMTVKLVRESFRHKTDNLVDLCGYAELLNRLEN